MGERDRIIDKLSEDWRFIQILIAIVVFGLMLLAYANLPPVVQLKLVPSLAVYILGAALLAYFERMADWYQFHRMDGIAAHRSASPWFFRVAVAGHLLWFGAWIAYMFWTVL